MAMARMRRVCLASAVRAASARNCKILRSLRVILIVDMLPAPRINDVLHRVTFAALWESPQESGSRAVGMRTSPRLNPLATDPIIVQRRDKMPVIIRIWPFDGAAHLPAQVLRALLTV